MPKKKSAGEFARKPESIPRPESSRLNNFRKKTVPPVRGALYTAGRAARGLGNSAEAAGVLATPVHPGAAGALTLGGWAGRGVGNALQQVGKNNQYAKRAKRAWKDYENSTAHKAGFLIPGHRNYEMMVDFADPDKTVPARRAVAGSRAGQIDEWGSQNIAGAYDIAKRTGHVNETFVQNMTGVSEFGTKLARGLSTAGRVASLIP
jgi:hypothetical protein